MFCRTQTFRVTLFTTKFNSLLLLPHFEILILSLEWWLVERFSESTIAYDSVKEDLWGICSFI